MKNLAEELISYSQKDYYPFHMPGHKGNPFSVAYEPSIETDITEINEFDNLHHAGGILLEGQRRAAALFGAEESLYSIGGSTAALLSAISAATDFGGKVLVARNCHKAVYHGIYLRQLVPVYLYPQREADFGLNGGISPRDVDNLLRREEGIQAVILTSPTYDGVVSDIGSICVIAHRYGVPVIVDEAHGAHFIFHQCFPHSAVRLGADVVIQSLHKTLPSMTQTALLHRNSDRIPGERLRRYMGIYQTSSPSYPLMASMDACITNLSEHSEPLFYAYTELLQEFYQKLRDCRKIILLTKDALKTGDIYDWDCSKILLFPRNCRMTGRELNKRLCKDYHLQMEMETGAYVLGITSVADRKEGFDRLSEAVCEIDRSIEYSGEESRPARGTFGKQVPIQRRTISQAMDAGKTYWNIEEATGRISSDFIYLYPPGIPLIVPGEEIKEDLGEYLKFCQEEGLEILGLNNQGKIGVADE